MTESSTPTAAFVSLLLSLGLGGQQIAEVTAAAEAAFASTARSRVSVEEQRRIWRDKAARLRARQRENVPETVPGTKPDPLLTKTTESLDKGSKKESVVPDVSGTTDDWPEDFLNQFWTAFPPFRRQAREKVGRKLASIRARTGKQKVTWATLFGGVRKFAGTSPGEYAPAPMVWLNDGRWDREYGSQQGGKNETATGARGATFSGIAARLRHRVESADTEFPRGNEPADGPERRD